MSGYVLGFGPSRDIIVEDRRESGKRDLEIGDNDDDHDDDYGHVAGILLGIPFPIRPAPSPPPEIRKSLRAIVYPETRRSTTQTLHVVPFWVAY